MKKFIALSLCVCLLLLCAACAPGSSENTPDASTDNDTTSGLQIPPVSYQAPMTAVSVPLQNQSSKADDGKTVFTYTYQNISLILADPHVAEQVVIDFLTRMDFTNTTAQSVLDAAKTAYKGQSDWSAYSFSKTYAPVRLDQNVLSFYGEEVVFMGFPRPTTAKISVTYDLSTGKALELRDVLATDYSADSLCKLIVDALKDQSTNGLLYSDYEYIISDMFSTNTPVESWYLSQRGLCFYFMPYEIAPYSSGTIVAQIPYEKLAGLIKDQYFSPEQPALYGTVLGKEFVDTDSSQIKQLSELVLDNDGKEYLIHTDGTLFNLCIETGKWSDDGKTFTPEAAVFAAASISAGDGVIIKANADTLAALRLTCHSGGNELSTSLSVLFN